MKHKIDMTQMTPVWSSSVTIAKRLSPVAGAGLESLDGDDMMCSDDQLSKFPGGCDCL